MVRPLVIALFFGAALSACGDASDEPPGPVLGCDPGAPATRDASCVAGFSPGEGAGFGMESFPNIVYGPPRGASAGGSLDVVSLGKGGQITLGFGGNSIVDGEGADFIVFENPFSVGGDPTKPFKELGEVSVSEDGEVFVPFPCATGVYPYEGCAGWRLVLSSPDNGVSPYDPAVAGGDPFDLATVGLSSARFVRIRDLSSYGAAPSAGFDLDAVSIVHPASP